jgi:hypothetical protein
LLAFGLFVFEVLAFEVLALEVLAFEVLAFEVLAFGVVVEVVEVVEVVVGQLAIVQVAAQGREIEQAAAETVRANVQEVAGEVEVVQKGRDESRVVDLGVSKGIM